MPRKPISAAAAAPVVSTPPAKPPVAPFLAHTAPEAAAAAAATENDGLILTKMTIISAHAEPVERAVRLPEQPGYSALKALVEPYLEGGKLEHVSVLYDDKRTDMFVHDTGALIPLARNVRATAIYRAAALADDPARSAESLPAVFGPAVIFDRQVWF